MGKKTGYILIAFVVLSLGLNLYHYGYQYVFQKGFNAGVNTVSNAVAQQYKDTGKIQLQMDGKAIILAPVGQPVVKQPDNVDKMFQ